VFFARLSGAGGIGSCLPPRPSGSGERASAPRHSPARRDPTDPSGDGRVYGAWRCWRQLRKEGVGVASCTVGRLVRGAGLVARRLRRGQMSCGCATSPTSAPGRGWAYLAVVLDVYSRRIVGRQLAPHMRDRLVDDALAMAITSRKRPGEPLVVGVHPATARHRHRPQPRPHRYRARQRDGRKRHRHDHDRTHQATPLADPAGSRAGTTNLDRLLQRTSHSSRNPGRFRVRSYAVSERHLEGELGGSVLGRFGPPPTSSSTHARYPDTGRSQCRGRPRGRVQSASKRLETNPARGLIEVSAKA
jgi:hypothetical protein